MKKRTYFRKRGEDGKLGGMDNNLYLYYLMGSYYHPDNEDGTPDLTANHSKALGRIVHIDNRIPCGYYAHKI